MRTRLDDRENLLQTKEMVEKLKLALSSFYEYEKHLISLFRYLIRAIRKVEKFIFDSCGKTELGKKE